VHAEAHAGLGWLIGNLPPTADRRLRNWCLGAAVLPDVDSVAYLLGPEAYGKLHHTFGHNVFVGVACVAFAALHHRRQPASRVALVALLVGLSFASHLLADAKLSAYPVYVFWPLSAQGYEFSPNLGLAAPINSYLVYASLAVVALLALWRRVTPLDVLSPALDHLVLSPLRPKPLECSVCGRRCGNRCEVCRAAVCLHHSKVTRGFRIRCASCAPPDG